MTNKFIEDIRKIAKTDELLKRLPNNRPDVDKASIGTQRGIGLADDVLDPCQVLYSNDDGVYTFEGLISGTAGPRIQDGDINHCTMVNTITGMKEIDGGTELYLKLKPDGQFLEPAYLVDMWYTSELIQEEWDLQQIGLGYLPDAPNSFDANTKWVFATAQEAANKSYEIFHAINAGTPTPGDPELEEISLIPTFTEEQVNQYNYSTTYPLYRIVLGVVEGFYEFHLIQSVPSNYDFTLCPPDGGGSCAPPPIETFPVMNTTTGSITGISYFDYDPPNFNALTFQLAIDIGATNLWKPNPAESGVYPIKYTNGVSIVRFKFGTGYSRYGLVRPAKDGGFALMETDETGEVLTGNAYIYKRSRTLAAVVPVSQVNAYLA